MVSDPPPIFTCYFSVFFFGLFLSPLIGAGHLLRLETFRSVLFVLPIFFRLSFPALSAAAAPVKIANEIIQSDMDTAV